MPQLIVRNLESRVVRKLREAAVRLGVSAEEAHRRILRQSLLGEGSPPLSFKEYLLSMPEDPGDEILVRKRPHGRRRINL
ncbi:MAG: hypothetical protein PHD76_07800 [Methylacidiphilales bacterium]|nr:hypothetical protein [Candidatus Methylacidiphilales bacterium]